MLFGIHNIAHTDLFRKVQQENTRGEFLTFGTGNGIVILSKYRDERKE